MAQNFESRPLSFSAPRTPGSDCSTSKAVNMCHIFSWLVRCGPRTTLHSRPFKKNKVVNQHAINPIVNGCLYSIFIHLYPTHLWLLLCYMLVILGTVHLLGRDGHLLEAAGHVSSALKGALPLSQLELQDFMELSSDGVK